MKLLKKGAEGDIFLTSWNNKKAILKARKKKNYRNPSLDQRIRKQRTIRESGIISDVKSFGISTPLIYYVDIK
ncbi:MAG: Kae1-associated kinase Bud32, partial [Nitrosopumilaceae archaeon]